MDAFDWNVVVVARWNRAILSPARIGERLFLLPPGTPLEVLVPLDGVTPYQIRHAGVTVIPSSDRLLLQTSEPQKSQLQLASEVATRAIEGLPETPFIACGINLRYRTDEPSGQFLSNTRCRTESILTDLGRTITSRRRGETVEFAEGRLNLMIDVHTEPQSVILFNFERQSTQVSDLVAWLGRDPQEYIDCAESVLEAIV